MFLKKSLGQHLLIDETILEKMVRALPPLSNYSHVLEIGPGTGALTKYLMKEEPDNLWLIEKDDRFAELLKKQFPMLKSKIIHGDFLTTELDKWCTHPTLVLGNFPYNISSQIIFKTLEEKDKIQTLVGMFQKEVAERIASVPGKKQYGVPSVLVQAYYHVTYLFDVPATAFKPPPKVVSGVIILERNNCQKLPCDESFFKTIVKTSFAQRRKMLRNSLKQFSERSSKLSTHEIWQRRPETLSVDEFIWLTNQLSDS